MTPEAVRRFFELRRIGLKHGVRLHIAKTEAERRKGWAFADTGPRTKVLWFDDLADADECIAPLAEV